MRLNEIELMRAVVMSSLVFLPYTKLHISFGNAQIRLYLCTEF